MQDMDQSILDLLDRIREKAGIPLVISCAYRSVEWDKKKGRSGKGAHPQRKAVDIIANADATRMKILKAAIECGVRRIGIAKTFIHIDNSETLSQGVVWLY